MSNRLARTAVAPAATVVRHTDLVDHKALEGTD